MIIKNILPRRNISDRSPTGPSFWALKILSCGLRLVYGHLIVAGLPASWDTVDLSISLDLIRYPHASHKSIHHRPISRKDTTASDFSCPRQKLLLQTSSNFSTHTIDAREDGIRFDRWSHGRSSGASIRQPFLFEQFIRAGEFIAGGTHHPQHSNN